MSFFTRLRLAVVLAALCVVGLPAQGPAPATDVRFPQLSERDVREWLTYLSSDELQGREVFTEGYGLAAGYIADHLREWNLTPLGDDGTYFQRVKQHGYQITRNSSVTIGAADAPHVFRHGDHVSFALMSGGSQTLHFTSAEIGSGFAGRDVRGKLVILLPGGSTPAVPAWVKFTGSHADYLVRFGGAAAVLNVVPSTGPESAEPSPPGSRRGGRGAGRPSGRGASANADVTTVERVDAPVPPVVNVDATVLEALAADAGLSPEARARLDGGQVVAPFTLSSLDVAIAVDNTFQIVSTALTENVVGMVQGSDPKLRDTYVFFGVHLDHMGYSHNGEPRGRVNVPIAEDRIWNGADDDGSGSAALLAIAKACATGPKPKRSMVFIWHAGEEAGLLGSRYMADHPVVPLDRVQAELNIDMIGRNRDDRPSEANTLYVIGADRISTDLHNLLVAVDGAMPEPLTLDFEYNDPTDPNDFYTRSDHYSYASKGIPVAFFFTGTHADYHANTDSVDKIIFPKLLRVAQMVYQLGYALAVSDRPLVRDNLGPRTGKGSHGPIGPPPR